MVRTALLFAAGTNCDQEMAHAFELAGSQVTYLHINKAKANPKLLRRYQILGVPGGFTYGDYIAAGRVMANELRFSLSEEIIRFIEDGKLILGVCNGFQVLVKAGILPGTDGYCTEQTVTLGFNDSQRFECRWVTLEPGDSRCVFLAGIERPLYMPVAHAEGKFTADSRATLDEIVDGRLVALRYARPAGTTAAKRSERPMSRRVPFPWNPNGSQQNIAGICDPTGRVFGLMPHPERFVRATQHPRWTREKIAEPDGLLVYQNAAKYARKNL
jgi:phosphoribosylformylglycinamidine synthase